MGPPSLPIRSASLVRSRFSRFFVTFVVLAWNLKLLFAMLFLLALFFAVSSKRQLWLKDSWEYVNKYTEVKTYTFTLSDSEGDVTDQFSSRMYTTHSIIASAVLEKNDGFLAIGYQDERYYLHKLRPNGDIIDVSSIEGLDVLVEEIIAVSFKAEISSLLVVVNLGSSGYRVFVLEMNGKAVLSDRILKSSLDGLPQDPCTMNVGDSFTLTHPPRFEYVPRRKPVVEYTGKYDASESEFIIQRYQKQSIDPSTPYIRYDVFGIDVLSIPSGKVYSMTSPNFDQYSFLGSPVFIQDFWTKKRSIINLVRGAGLDTFVLFSFDFETLKLVSNHTLFYFDSGKPIRSDGQTRFGLCDNFGGGVLISSCEGNSTVNLYSAATDGNCSWAQPVTRLPTCVDPLQLKTNNIDSMLLYGAFNPDDHSRIGSIFLMDYDTRSGTYYTHRFAYAGMQPSIYRKDKNSTYSVLNFKTYEGGGWELYVTIDGLNVNRYIFIGKEDFYRIDFFIHSKLVYILWKDQAVIKVYHCEGKQIPELTTEVPKSFLDNADVDSVVRKFVHKTWTR